MTGLGWCAGVGRSLVTAAELEVFNLFQEKVYLFQEKVYLFQEKVYLRPKLSRKMCTDGFRRVSYIISVQPEPPVVKHALTVQNHG